MSRPTVAHDGFFVPNAQDVARPGMAEPDRIDFNTLGNSRWGVIEGCLVTVSLSSAHVTAGTALVNGALVSVVGGQSASVDTGDPQDRYDLIGINGSGALKVIRGTPATDPVFPDPPKDFTTLASVLATAGGDSFGDHVVDKRNFLLDSLLTKIPPTSSLIVNRNGSGNLYKVTGRGDVSWNDDTWMERIAVGRLQVRNHLEVRGTLTVDGATTADSVTALKRTTGTNLRNAAALPGTADLGDFFQDNVTGRVYVWQNNQWEELATLRSAMPVGTIITSLQSPAVMIADGWVPLDGKTSVNESTHPTLFTIPALASYINFSSTPHTMLLPDATRRVFITDFTDAGKTGGAFTFRILEGNLPPHVHNVSTKSGGGGPITGTLGQAGSHRHNIGGGAHPHNDVPDPGHAHNGFERADGGEAIVRATTGRNTLDAFFNDRSHTHHCEPVSWTRTAYTGITRIGSTGSDHSHSIDNSGDHTHALTLSALGTHVHGVNETSVGSGTEIPYNPAYFAVYSYIRS